MPAKKKDAVIPRWVFETGDECLEETLVEAYVARFKAFEAGAPRAGAACAKAFRSADVTVAAIQDGRSTGKLACKKAAVALRKYNTALECAEPTASRDE